MATVQDARSNISKYDKTINEELRSLRTSVSEVGACGVRAASKKTKLCYLIPLSASLLGIILCMCGHWFWGIIHIALGVFLCVKIGNAAKAVENKIVSRSKDLEQRLSNNNY